MRRPGDVERDRQPLAGARTARCRATWSRGTGPAARASARSWRNGGRSRPSSACGSPSFSQPSWPRSIVRQRHVEGRADPAGGMDMVGMEAGAGSRTDQEPAKRTGDRFGRQARMAGLAAAAAGRCGARPRRRSPPAAPGSPARSGRRAARRSGCRRAPIARAAGGDRGGGRAAVSASAPSEGSVVADVVDADQPLIALQPLPSADRRSAARRSRHRARRDRPPDRRARARRMPPPRRGGRRAAGGADSAPPW